MQIIAIANQKGGVGKTTTAVTLGGLLARRGERVLLMDLDPHGSLTSYCHYDPEAEELSGYNLFQRRKAKQPLAVDTLIKQTPVDGMHLICAHTAMATLDRQLGVTPGMGRVVSDGLSALENRYSRVLIDCPPMLGILMVNALAACNKLIIPVQTEFLALKGLDRMIKTLAMIKKTRTTPFESLIVPTLYDKRTRASADALKILRQNYHADLWSEVIPIDTMFREASRLGKPLSQLQPGSRGVRAYGRLLDFIDDRAISQLEEG